MAYAMHFKSKKIILICEKLILEKLLLNRPQTCKEEGFYNTQKKLELKLYCIKVFQNLYPATSAGGEDFTQKYFIFLIFQETQQPCFNSAITPILRNQINVTKLKILKDSLKIKQSKSNSCNYFNESKIEREAESESECQHNDYQDKLRDCAKEGENEIAINKSVHNYEYEIAEKSKEDGKEFNGTDCVKDSISQQIKTLCNLGGNILDHPGFLIKPQTWTVCIQDTATFNPQNPIDVRGIPWAWLREEKWRLQTFAKYPLNAKKSAILLAEAGFAYIGSGKDSDDTVICFNCKIIKRNWLEFEDIKETHQSMSPTCAMVIGTRGVNIPMIASENVSFGRPQQTNNQNAIDVDCPEAKNHQLSAPRGASNKHRGSFQLATHSVMSPPTAKPQQSQPSHVENRPDLRQASEAGGSSHLVTSNTIPSVSRNNSEERESQGPQQYGSAMSQQSQGAASETGQTNFSSARTVSDSGRNEPGIGNGPSETNTSSTSSARPTSSQSSPTPTSSSNATAVNQSSVPLSVNHSSNTTPYTQSPSSATQSSTATSTTQPPTPATATQSSTTVPSNQSSTPTSNPASVPQNPTYMELGIITERPKRYEYAVRAKRLETFGDWPEGHHLRKEDLADAGYYYAGYGDCARCFYCGGGLRNWEQDDDVWVEHARWFPKCAFIRQRLGQVFIDTVAFLAQTKDKISFMDVVKEMKIDPAAFQIDSKETPLKNDAAVVAVKNMGYREKDILPTAATLKESGQILSADILFTALEEKGVQRLNVSTNMNESNPSMSVNRDKAKDEELLHSLKQTNNDLRLQTLCKICMDKEVAVVFLPCGHLVCCTECAAAMKDCPVCRNQVKGVVRAFMG